MPIFQPCFEPQEPEESEEQAQARIKTESDQRVERFRSLLESQFPPPDAGVVSLFYSAFEEVRYHINDEGWSHNTALSYGLAEVLERRDISPAKGFHVYFALFEKKFQKWDVARDAIKWQADHVKKNAATRTASVIRGLIPLLDGETECARRMREWPDLSLEDHMPLRIAGGLHNLHLTGADARLGPIYSGSVTDQDEIDGIIGAVVLDHDAVLAPWFDGPPQTNEAGRSACIMAMLLWLATKLNVSRFELLELGASAGINAMMDRFGFDLGGTRAGDPTSPMQIKPAEWRGPPPPAVQGLEIVSIKGCDLSPMDLTDPATALRLKSYVWAEVTERLERIDAAVALAAAKPPRLEQADALDFVRRELLESEGQDGVVRVIFHTVVWQYIPKPTRAAIKKLIEEAGSKASAERPLAWIMVEVDRNTFRQQLRARYWPGGDKKVVLGESHVHGAWVEWRAPAE